jgi:hypothetical protein
VADVVVDRANLDAAAMEVRLHAQGSLRFALDMIGKETATWCQSILASCSASRCVSPDISVTKSSVFKNDTDGNLTPRQQQSTLSHLVCLTGEPKTTLPSVRAHKVPIKLFHTNPRLGSRLSRWLYRLLDVEELKLPEVRVVDGGLGVVNSCLELLKSGEVSGSRVVVRMNDSSVGGIVQ